MNGNVYMSKINELKINYIIQLILFGIILASNFTLSLFIIWLFRLLHYLYLLLSVFVIIYIIISIIPLVFIKINKINLTIIKHFKRISLVMSCLTIITGCGLTFILLANSLEMTDFCRECPFNLPNSYINHIYDKYINNNLNEKKLKRQCSDRRCLYNNNIIPDDKYKYEYICNYNPVSEFESIKNNNSSNDTINQIVCSIVDKNSVYNIILENNEINKYFELCNNLNKFYICQRINRPKNYKIKEDFQCPNKSYVNYLIFFCLLNITFNLILSFLSWNSEYIKYKDIIKLFNINTNNRIGTNSLNSTQNTSKIQKEGHEESFKEENIETIIVCTNENLINKDIRSSNGLTLTNNKGQKDIQINPQINNENPLKICESNKEEVNSEKIFNLNNIVSDKKEEEKPNEKEEKPNETKERNIIIINSQYISSERNIATINSE